MSLITYMFKCDNNRNTRYKGKLAFLLAEVILVVSGHVYSTLIWIKMKMSEINVYKNIIALHVSGKH